MARDDDAGVVGGAAAVPVAVASEVIVAGEAESGEAEEPPGAAGPIFVFGLGWMWLGLMVHQGPPFALFLLICAVPVTIWAHWLGAATTVPGEPAAAG